MPLISAPAVEGANSPETDQIYLWLLEIDVDGTLHRFVNNNEAIVSGGQTYKALPFELPRPRETDREPETSLTIVNVDREIGDTVRAATAVPTVTFKKIVAATPDTIEETWPGFQLVDAVWNAARLSSTLTQVRLGAEKATRKRITKAGFPSLSMRR